jgi:hypothetical protein
MKKQFRTTIKANIPNDLIGMIGLTTQAKNATDDVKDVTSIYTAAFLHAYDILKIGLSFKALIHKEFYQES